MSANPAIHPLPNGDVDIELPDDESQAVASGEAPTEQEASTNPANLDHPEEVMGE